MYGYKHLLSLSGNGQRIYKMFRARPPFSVHPRPRPCAFPSYGALMPILLPLGVLLPQLCVRASSGLVR